MKEVIRSFRHKGLKLLFEEDNASGVNQQHASKLRNILAALHAVQRLLTWTYPVFDCIGSKAG